VPPLSWYAFSHKNLTSEGEPVRTVGLALQKLQQGQAYEDGGLSGTDTPRLHVC
jgi:hypothetical protein